MPIFIENGVVNLPVFCSETRIIMEQNGANTCFCVNCAHLKQPANVFLYSKLRGDVM